MGRKQDIPELLCETLDQLKLRGSVIESWLKYWERRPTLKVPPKIHMSHIADADYHGWLIAAVESRRAGEARRRQASVKERLGPRISVKDRLGARDSVKDRLGPRVEARKPGRRAYKPKDKEKALNG